MLNCLELKHSRGLAADGNRGSKKPAFAGGSSCHFGLYEPYPNEKLALAVGPGFGVASAVACLVPATYNLPRNTQLTKYLAALDMHVKVLF